MSHLLLITGAAGFIGSNLVYWLRRKQPEVRIVILDALTYAGHLPTLAALPYTENETEFSKEKPILFVRGDICDQELLQRLFTRHAFTGVLNLAAESHVDRSIAGAQPFLRTNIIGTQTLLDVARLNGNPRFVQISTDEVYGSLGPEGKFTETTPLAPNSPYSASKASADHFVRAAFHTFDQPVSITRCSNNYGPYQFPEKMMPLMMTNAMNDTPLPVYGDGLNVRDWIFVEDHCAGIWATFERGQPGEVYNFGGDSERTNLDVVRQILKLAGKTESLIRYVTDRLGHDRRYAVDFSKSTRELGWQPSVKFEEGLARTFAWYRDNANWWQPLRH
ncbi:MAG: dTDP-glucose 4,6-dehydratase [Verrucomicrobia bacterium Tous-C9LFEB]|nr:MAG: dTDP-glucose 4,6-dehydratase [Verrucomicrobia bacterium Tous-C9LFEB]